MGAELGPGEVNRVWREVEGIAVPVQRGEGLWQYRGGGIGGGGARWSGHRMDGPPADLAVPGRIDPLTEGAGDELGTQAEAEDRLSGVDGLANVLFFGPQKAVLLFIIDGHGPTQNHKQSLRVRLRQRLGQPEPVCGGWQSVGMGPVGNGGRSFEGHMLKKADRFRWA